MATQTQVTFTATHTTRLCSTTIETELALQTSASTDITWITHPNYIDNTFISKQRDDDSNYSNAV